MNTSYLRKLLLGTLLGGLSVLPAYAAEPVRLGLIEPFSGPIASIGLETLDNFNFAVEAVNKRGGVLGGRMIEMVPLDNAMNAEKSTQQVKKAIDMGIRVVVQGVGSSNAINIIEYVNKHNKRNPDQTVLYLNHAAVTTEFTNELCSFWHFRFDANVDMKVAALATQMGRDPKVKNVYLINQNYAFGKSTQEASNKYLAERAKHIKIVGDDLIVPFGKVQDFTPYVAKIKGANADTVLTGNWGPDIIRLVKAVASAGLNVQFYTLYGGLPTTVNAVGTEDGMAVHMKQVTEQLVEDDDRKDLQPYFESYLDKFKRTWYSDRIRFTVEMFAKAIDKAGKEDPEAIARALEGMTFPGPHGQTMVMRPDDHQIQLPMVISEMSRDVPKRFIYEGKDLGIGWKTMNWVSREDLTLPTTCKMERP
ncbi:MAG: branched-chain amino acid ABC transporter substrate-binding protein [Candidatus Lambdaproteobacteria bacterium]|nr:branched-chain amino acid ABC transporter substrate-binding protein [Candidatus Lambdaproteobacteria bacterium]